MPLEKIYLDFEFVPEILLCFYFLQGAVFQVCTNEKDHYYSVERESSTSCLKKNIHIRMTYYVFIFPGTKLVLEISIQDADESRPGLEIDSPSNNLQLWIP